MKQFLIAVVVAAATASLANQALAADVGVSVTYGEPGFYGRLDIGDYPQPQVIYRRPVMIERVPFDRAPVYLHVPPGHAKNWRKHCSKYDACGERVYFVQDNWYNREYVPRYQEQQHTRQDDRHEERRDDHRGGQKNDHRGDSHGRNR
ncbi:MAG: hypothetical protein PHQ05_08260 [Sterolibacterium sp.]|nr:hypothetical protein [Sterolibacterium sp.]